MNKKENVEELVNTVFTITGALLMYFAGYEIGRSPIILSFILGFMGLIILMVRIEYEKEETENEQE